MNVSCSFCPRSTPVFRARDTAACWMGFRPRARTGRSILRSEVDSDDAMVAGEQWSRCRPVARPLRFQVDTRPTLAARDGRSLSGRHTPHPCCRGWRVASLACCPCPCSEVDADDAMVAGAGCRATDKPHPSEIRTLLRPEPPAPSARPSAAAISSITHKCTVHLLCPRCPYLSVHHGAQ